MALELVAGNDPLPQTQGQCDNQVNAVIFPGHTLKTLKRRKTSFCLSEPHSGTHAHSLIARYANQYTTETLENSHQT